MKRKTWCMAAVGVLLLLTGCGTVAKAAGTSGTAAGVKTLQSADIAKDTLLRQEQGRQAEAGGECKTRAYRPCGTYGAVRNHIPGLPRLVEYLPDGCLYLSGGI